MGRFIFLRSIINHSFISNFGSSERYSVWIVVLKLYLQVQKSTVRPHKKKFLIVPARPFETHRPHFFILFFIFFYNHKKQPFQ